MRPEDTNKPVCSGDLGFGWGAMVRTASPARRWRAASPGLGFAAGLGRRDVRCFRRRRRTGRRWRDGAIGCVVPQVCLSY